ncbi:MAG: uracil-DNA glycosylase [Acidobacteriota bacterium]
MTDEVLADLALLRDFGFTHLDLNRRVSASSSLPGNEAQDVSPSTTRSLDDSTTDFAALPPATANPEWDALAAEAHDCTRCRLSASRTNVVFGVGDPNADLMFIGEAPGRDEDLQAEPFVGRAGQLLTDIIKAMHLSREQVYIANVIKCRPPENRNPEPDELDQCRPFIRRQVEMIQPKVIVTLGRFGLQSLTEKSYAISSVRGHWLDYEGIKLMPTYHPAYLLRTPSAKKDVWTDMKKVMAELGLTP